jgi:hypothetical protein
MVSGAKKFISWFLIGYSSLNKCVLSLNYPNKGCCKIYATIYLLSIKHYQSVDVVEAGFLALQPLLEYLE